MLELVFTGIACGESAEIRGRSPLGVRSGHRGGFPSGGAYRVLLLYAQEREYRTKVVMTSDDDGGDG